MARRIESLYINDASGLSLAGATFTSSKPVTLNLPKSAGDLLTTTSSDTLTNKVLNDSSNDVAANKLRAGKYTLDLKAEAPKPGQILTALNEKGAAWQTLSLPGAEVSSAELNLEKADSAVLESFKTEAQTVYYLNTQVVSLHQKQAAAFTLKAAFYHNGEKLERLGRDDLIEFGDTSDKVRARLSRSKSKFNLQTTIQDNQIQLQVQGVGKWKSSTQLVSLN